MVTMMKYQKLYEAEELENIRDILANAVDKYPDNNAFILKDEPKSRQYEYITYRRFQEEINALGTALMQMGYAGKRIAVISPNRYEWALAYFAVLNGVGIVVPLDKGLPEGEISSLLERSRCDAVIFSREYAEAFKERKDIGLFCMDEGEGFTYIGELVEKGKKSLAQGNRQYLDVPIPCEEMRVILFTSGTTSASKAVMLSHRNIAANIYAMACCERFFATDVNLAFLPFHHTFGSTGLLMFLAHGAANVFCDGLRYVSQNLEEYKVTVFVCVPLIIESMYKKILQTAEKKGSLKKLMLGRKISRLLMKIGIDIRAKLFKEVLDGLGGHMRFVISGASAIDSEVPKAFNEFGILTVQGYGLTETSPVLTAENEKCIRSGSVGIPLLNVEIKIDSPDAQGIGEIIARGPNVMMGYYENKEATDEVLRGGWFHTGDLGYIDRDGYVFITGRKKNVIVLKNGKNVFPEELEILVNELPYVTESMVFGFPKDDDYTVSVKIVYDEGIFGSENPEGIIWEDIKKINARIAKHQYIKKLILSTEPMEKTTTAKIKRFEEIKRILEKES